MLFGAATSQLALIGAGLAWPAYQSYKATSAQPQSPAACRDWLVYWIVLAVFLAVQWLADFAISWLPLYYDAKVAFVVMLWHPKVRGAAFLYAQYLEPLLRSHEHSIDRNIGETRTWALDFATGHLARLKQYATTHTAQLLDHVKHFSEQGTAPQPAHTAQAHAHAE